MDGSLPNKIKLHTYISTTRILKHDLYNKKDIQVRVCTISIINRNRKCLYFDLLFIISQKMLWNNKRCVSIPFLKTIVDASQTNSTANCCLTV